MKPGDNYSQDNSQWNFCTFANSNNGKYDISDTFAFLTRTGSSWTLPMTNYDQNYDSAINQEGGNGVTIVQKSDTKCAINNDKTSFKATIQCDWSIKAQGEAKIVSVDSKSSPCQL